MKEESSVGRAVLTERNNLLVIPSNPGMKNAGTRQLCWLVLDCPMKIYFFNNTHLFQ